MRTFTIAKNSVRLVTLFLLNQGHAQGNLVFNGGFDANASGWTVSNIMGTGYAAIGGNPGGRLVLGAGISNVPTASQAISSLTPGVVYLVSGDFEASKGNSTNFSFGVALDGVFLFQTVEPGDFDWHSFSFFYTASSPSAVLSLSSQLNGTGISYSIDNIAMQIIPEPSGISLLLLGAGVWFSVRHSSRICFRPK